jgi:hypothetical protein
MDLKKAFLHSVVAVSLLGTFTACSSSDDDSSSNTDDQTECDTTGTTLSGEITCDRTLTKDNDYKIDGLVKVKNGATLTIEAGTTLYGSAKGYMVVTKGSKIIANGTEAEPIIFTSEIAYNDPTVGTSGQWGGLTILGDATTNLTDAKYEVNEADPDFAFGGTNATDNSGSLKYVKILNSGVAVEPNKEVNGLSFCGVGSGTVVENIYVENSADDGIELWGGTVNLTDIEIKNALDDSFDIDSGYSGTVTNLKITQVDAAKAGIEASSGGTPMTTATFKNLNITTVSGSSEGGIYIKDGTTAPTFEDVTVDHNGNDGTVFVALNLDPDAKSAIKFTNFSSTGTVQTITGDGANDVKDQLTDLTVVTE